MTSHPLDSRITITNAGAEIDIHPTDLDKYLAVGWKVVSDEEKATRIQAV